MFRRFLILFFIVLVSFSSLFAKNDSLVEATKHNPKKATIYSAVLPGLGQAYNKKYWKIPIVYAGLGTIFYFANTNGGYYKDYRDAYDYKTGTITEADAEIVSIANKYSAENLINIRDNYRRNMELSWIVMALWYGLNIIDATVDAHFFEYDIGDDLTLKIDPIVQPYSFDNVYGYGCSYKGLSLKIKF